MNIVNTLARVLKGGRRMDGDKEDQFLFRLKEADDTNTGLERRIIKLADGSSVTEISRSLRENGNGVWSTWFEKWMPEAIQSLEQRGFIRIENRPKSLRSCD